MRKIVVFHSDGVGEDDWFCAELVDDHLEYGKGRVRASCMGSFEFVLRVIRDDWGLESFGLKEKI